MKHSKMVARHFGRRFLTCSLAFGLLACGKHDHPDGHAHDAGERGGGGAVTLFTPKAELFMEYKGLVVGMETGFAAHLTVLADYHPVTAGQVEMEFISSDGSRMEARAEGPSNPGIFRPIVKPVKAGIYKAVLRISGPQLADTFVVENLQVTEKPLPAEEEAKVPNEISFLKEQAWKIPFHTEAIQVKELARSLSVYGETAPASGKHSVVSAPLTGIVLAEKNAGMPLVGQWVKAKAPLLRITPPAAGTEGWTAYTQNQEAADIARGEYEKAKRLHEKGAIPLSELRQAELAYKVHRSGSTDYVVSAPLSGYVVQSNVVMGKQVAAGEPLLEIMDPAVVWVKANLPLSAMATSRDVRGANVILSNAEKPMTGKLISVSSIADPATKAVPALFEVANPGEALRIGTPVTVEVFLNARESVLAVPESALFDDDGKLVVYVQTGGESFEKRIVEKAYISGGWAAIKTGLSPGERIVTLGGYQVRMASLSSSVPAHGHAH
ncbi:MAG: efflux RND transporter periplasmic adaptor subunit [Fibrobacteria bacterium]